MLTTRLRQEVPDADEEDEFKELVTNGPVRYTTSFSTRCRTEHAAHGS